MLCGMCVMLFHDLPLVYGPPPPPWQSCSPLSPAQEFLHALICNVDPAAHLLNMPDSAAQPGWGGCNMGGPGAGPPGAGVGAGGGQMVTYEANMQHPATHRPVKVRGGAGAPACYCLVKV